MFKEAIYIKSIEDIKDAPESKPQFLLLGRSNVGKSSFINTLTNRKNLARVSNTPGKTVLLNYFLIDQSFYLVDAPGYGYARRSHKDKDQFIIMIENYLLHAPNLKAVYLLMDFKVGPTSQDLETYTFLKSMGKKVIIILTKKDKIPKTKQYKQEKEIKSVLGQNDNVYSYSSVTKENLELIKQSFINQI